MSRYSLAAEAPAPEEPPSEIEDYLFDPDPAVIRAGLLGQLGNELGAVPVDRGVAVLTGPEPIHSPFADCYQVEDAAPFHVSRLRAYLRERGVGRVTVLKRAVDLDVNDVIRKLKLAGPEHRHLILTRSLARTVGIVAEQVSNAESPGTAVPGL